MEINFKGPVMPVDPYSQMAFVEILNILLTAGHIVDVNRFPDKQECQSAIRLVVRIFQMVILRQPLYPVATGGIQLAALLQPAHIQHPFRDAGKP